MKPEELAKRRKLEDVARELRELQGKYIVETAQKLKAEIPQDFQDEEEEGMELYAHTLNMDLAQKLLDVSIKALQELSQILEKARKSPKAVDFQDPFDDQIEHEYGIMFIGIPENEQININIQDLENARKGLKGLDRYIHEYWQFHEDEAITDLENVRNMTENPQKPSEDENLESRNWKIWD